MTPHVQEFSQEFAASAEHVFDWHEQPGAFDRLNPPWDPVQVIEHLGGIRDGARVTLRVPIGPFSIQWQLEHSDYQHARQFRDTQRRGPFRSYSHTHSFESLSPTTSKMIDHLEYSFPFDALSSLIATPIMRRKLVSVFRYRHRITSLDIERHQRFSHIPRQHIVVSGASGLIGSALTPYLTTAGHRVSRLVRTSSASNADEIPWDPNVRVQFPTLTGIDAVVHLAGEGIADKRWSQARKRQIRDSRMRGTTTLCEALLSLTPRPKTLVCASAIGIYGSRGETILEEDAPRGEGFLSDVAAEWEETTEIARAAGIRVVHARFGIVLSPRGGALQKMLLPFSLGLGGPLGSGTQWMSWIGIDDVLGLIEHALFTDTLSGPLNVVAPHPVTNNEFTESLARVLHRPAPMRVPAFALRLALGELADEALLCSARASAKKAQATGYVFRDPELEPALAHLLGREPPSHSSD